MIADVLTKEIVFPKTRTDIKKFREAELACKEVVSQIETSINCFGFDVKREADAILSSENASSIMLRTAKIWVRILPYLKENNLYDGRNEHSVTVGEKLFSENPEFFAGFSNSDESVRRLAENDFAYSGLYSEEAYIAKAAMRFHRTIQQRFSSLVFCYLKGYFPGMEEGWWRMPFI